MNNAEEQEGVRVAAKLARESLDLIAAMIQPGITTDELDQALFKAAIERGCYPSPLGYHGFPKSVCTSVNEVICHGIPDQRKLEDGDIINLGTCSMLMPDVTLYHNGAYLFLTCNQASTATCTLLYSPRNATYPVGDKARENAEWMKLIRTARYARLFPDRSECLDAAIAICGPGMPYAEVGRVIQPIVERNGCCIVKNYTGHGIGRVFHGPPPVFHYPTKKSYGIMQPGHVRIPISHRSLRAYFKLTLGSSPWSTSAKSGVRSSGRTTGRLPRGMGRHRPPPKRPCSLPKRV